MYQSEFGNVAEKVCGRLWFGIVEKFQEKVEWQIVEKVWECNLEIPFRILKDYRKFKKKFFFCNSIQFGLEFEIIFLIIFLVWEARRKVGDDGEDVVEMLLGMYQSEFENVV